MDKIRPWEYTGTHGIHVGRGGAKDPRPAKLAFAANWREREATAERLRDRTRLAGDVSESEEELSDDGLRSPRDHGASSRQPLDMLCDGP